MVSDTGRFERHGEDESHKFEQKPIQRDGMNRLGKSQRDLAKDGFNRMAGGLFDICHCRRISTSRIALAYFHNFGIMSAFGDRGSQTVELSICIKEPRDCNFAAPKQRKTQRVPEVTRSLTDGRNQTA